MKGAVIMPRTKKTTTKLKPQPQMRLFFGGSLYHESVYEGEGRAKTTYHNDSLTDSFEQKLTERLTEAAKHIIAEDPDSPLLSL